jgi:phenylpropionate dioxygenase-like ring-hydroxylating dioxygenase large terminal subunit
MIRKCWHPVTYARELKDKPLATMVCGEPVVLWRDSKGSAAAVKDLCIHRGTALSLGTVCGDEIVCPYHGWRFGGDGKCKFIPQLADPQKVPQKARVSSYQCCERFGLIWVCLEEPLYPLPEIPELMDSSWRVVETGPFEWQSNSARQVENFTDFAHFPFVHPGLLGDPNRLQVPDHSVELQGNVLVYEVVRPEAKNTEEFPIFGNPNQEAPMRHNRYWLHLPYTIVLRIAWSSTDNRMLYLFTSQPVSEKRCIGYCIIAKNYGGDDSKALKEFEDVIFNQDKRIVESQRPEQVPFDLSEELHLKFDGVAVGYRRAMGKLGFGPD